MHNVLVKYIEDFILCYRTGRDRDYSNNQNRLHFKKIYSLISSLDQLAKNISWQSIDKQIYRLGFDYAFFNVRVVQDPHNLQENIILVIRFSHFLFYVIIQAFIYVKSLPCIFS